MKLRRVGRRAFNASAEFPKDLRKPCLRAWCQKQVFDITGNRRVRKS
jgi:hypothetical protein